ncbi:DUF4189 domain-containing protein [Mycobacterium sp. NBC_00419]|uniref:DUF4189 domain-containing protein n=1 Tax=Mycobacterium sp. NBC_00419 TaxID=2975989 RepID=UPI002E1E831F
MALNRKTSTIFAIGAVVATLSVGTAWAGGPDGAVEQVGDISQAVGSGVLNGALTGFSASGPTNESASAAVIAACQQSGAQECSRDEVTNDSLCVVSVGSDDTGVVSGGAGPTVEAARDDAFAHAAQANASFDPGARILVSACP